MKKRAECHHEKLYTHKKTGVFARLFNFLLTKIIFRKMQFVFHNEMPEEPSVLVGNHTKIMAPLMMQYVYPEQLRTWSNGSLSEKKTCVDMLKNFTIKGLKGEWFYSKIVVVLAPIITRFFRKTLNSIPVYHDWRIVKTFDESILTLEHGSHLAIYPEIKKAALNEVLCPFATGFVYLAYNYYKETGKSLKFYPVYCAPSLKETHIGKPIQYDPEVSIKKQSKDVVEYLQNTITQLARDLPSHKIAHLLKDFTLEE